MKQFSAADYGEYQSYINTLFQNELDDGARFSMFTSLTPALLSDEEAKGFVNRYASIKTFWTISQDLFKKALFDDEYAYIRNLVLNEVNPQFALAYHKELYEHEVDQPYFFRTDESIPGKITEIQSPGSGWGTVQALQVSIPYLQKHSSFPIRSFNEKTVAEKLAQSITKLTGGTPRIFHQIDESSVMLDTNYFISTTRKYGLRYLGHDYDVSFKNANFLRTHSFLEQATGSTFYEYLERYHHKEVLFDIFPSILFFQKISLIFPFWEKTRNLYPDHVRDLFPFTSLIEDTLLLEDGTRLTPEQFSQRKPHERDYYLKYGGTDGTINWGSKAVYHLGKTDWKKCEALLIKAKADYHAGKYWILQKAHHRKEKVTTLKEEALTTQESYGKWSGFYGPDGFLGGYVMTRGFYKVHGQDDTVCRLLV